MIKKITKRTVFLLVSLAVVLAACIPQFSIFHKTKISPPFQIDLPNGLPKHTIFTLCHLGETVTIIDADTWTIAGYITHPEIRSTADLALSNQKILYLTRDGDAGEVSETLIPIDLKTGKILDYVVLSRAPFRIAISKSGIAVVTHVAILGDGRTQVSFVDTRTNHRISTQVVNGSATYVATKSNYAYVLVAAWTPMQENHLLVYDLDELQIERKYALPPGDIPLDGNFIVDKGKMFYVSFDENAYQYKYKIIELHMGSGRTRVVATLPTAGELGLLSNGNLIVSAGGYDPNAPLRLINTSNGKTMKELFVGSNTNVVQSLGKDIFAINAEGDNALVIVDGRNLKVIRRINAPCKPFILRMHFAEVD